MSCLNETPHATDLKKMRILKAMRKDLVPDWAYVSEDIHILAQKLDKMCEDEMIKLMIKWVCV